MILVSHDSRYVNAGLMSRDYQSPELISFFLITDKDRRGVERGTFWIVDRFSNYMDGHRLRIRESSTAVLSRMLLFLLFVAKSTHHLEIVSGRSHYKIRNVAIEVLILDLRDSNPAICFLH